MLGLALVFDVLITIPLMFLLGLHSLAVPLGMVTSIAPWIIYGSSTRFRNIVDGKSR